MTDLPPPILVSANPVPDIVSSNLRMVLVSLGAFAVGKGWVKGADIDSLIPILLIIIPWAWGQISRFAVQQKLRTAAADPRVPDSAVKLK